ncbi:MAG: anhydro-N-acetylmuramic acid kinase [Fidelibacterota bacterium]
MVEDRLSGLKNKRPLCMIGLMSGTSMDGLDICQVEVDFRGDSVDFDVKGYRTQPFPSRLREAIAAALTGKAEEISSLHYRLGRFYAERASRFILESKSNHIDAVAMHGQTLYHSSGEHTLQVGEPSFLAEALGVPVISDFRARDIAVGGTGAPLIPIVDKWIFQREKEAVICLNLGGIGNITYLPSRLSGHPVVGFDTGPGMCLLDEAVWKLGRKKLDRGGSLALKGQPMEDWVDRWMEDEFVRMKPPKSTGRDRFGTAWLDANLPGNQENRLEDTLASLSLFTARSVVLNCRQFTDLRPVKAVIVSGGGVHHGCMMEMLNREFAPVDVVLSSDLGVDCDMKEALGFALLGAAFLKGIPGNLPSVTGASRPVLLGKLTP